VNEHATTVRNAMDMRHLSVGIMPRATGGVDHEHREAAGDRAEVSVLVQVAPEDAVSIFTDTEEIDAWWRGGLRYRIGKRLQGRGDRPGDHVATAPSPRAAMARDQLRPYRDDRGRRSLRAHCRWDDGDGAAQRLGAYPTRHTRIDVARMYRRICGTWRCGGAA